MRMLTFWRKFTYCRFLSVLLDNVFKPHYVHFSLNMSQGANCAQKHTQRLVKRRIGCRRWKWWRVKRLERGGRRSKRYSESKTDIKDEDRQKKDLNKFQVWNVCEAAYAEKRILELDYKQNIHGKFSAKPPQPEAERGGRQERRRKQMKKLHKNSTALIRREQKWPMAWM